MGLCCKCKKSIIDRLQLSSKHAGYEFDVMSIVGEFYSGNGSSAYNSTTLGASSDVGVVELNEWTHIAAVDWALLTLFKNGSKVTKMQVFLILLLIHLLLYI